MFPSSRVRAAVLLLAAGAQAGPAAARWSLTVAPSLTAPRMAHLNDALMTEGLQPMQALMGSPPAVGFARARWGFGGDLALAYDFDEEMRGALQVGLIDVRTSDHNDLVSQTGTRFEVSERVSLPAARFSAHIQHVFRFEDNPDFRLHIGGWASIGTLVGATLSGHLTWTATGSTTDYNTSLSGLGWGGGALLGAEWSVAPLAGLFLEAGFDVFRIAVVDARTSYTGPTGTTFRSSVRLLKNGNGRNIDLDYSGVFLRLGVRFNLSPPS